MSAVSGRAHSPHRKLLTSMSNQSESLFTPSRNRLLKRPSMRPVIGAGQMWRVPEQNIDCVEPTLTLIDSVEPPHFLLHALHQHNYFRTVRSLRCPRCQSLSANVAIHKTIIFARRDVLFKFPLPCPLIVISRRCGTSVANNTEAEKALEDAWSRGISSTWAGWGGFDMGDTGERLGDRVSSPRRISGATLKSNSIRNSLRRSYQAEIHYRINMESTTIGTTLWCNAIFDELSSFYETVKDVCVGDRSPMSMACSPTFLSSYISRDRAEVLVARHCVNIGKLPGFDLSEFPQMCKYMATSPRSDQFVLHTLLEIKKNWENGSNNRLAIGNLLCLAVRAQQCLSLHIVSITVHDLLELYLVAFGGRSDVRGSTNNTPQQCTIAPPPAASPVASVMDLDDRSPAPAKPLDSRMSSTLHYQSSMLLPGSLPLTLRSAGKTGTLTFLDLQDIITEHVTIDGDINQGWGPLVANNLIDVRGADMDDALKQLLARGTTVKAYQALMNTKSFRLDNLNGSVPLMDSFDGRPTNPNASLNISECPISRHAQPVLLTTDASVIGGSAYIGKPEINDSGTSESVVACAQILFCFFVRLVSEGCSAVLVVERFRVYAQCSFSETDKRDESLGSPISSRGILSENHFWTLVTGVDHGIKYAHLLSQVSLQHEKDWCMHSGSARLSAAENDVLVLLLEDGTTLFVALNNIPRSATVRVDKVSGIASSLMESHIGGPLNQTFASSEENVPDSLKPVGSAHSLLRHHSKSAIGHVPIHDQSELLSVSFNLASSFDAKRPTERYSCSKADYTNSYVLASTFGQVGQGHDETVVIMDMPTSYYPKENLPGLPFISPEAISGSSPSTSANESAAPLPTLVPWPSSLHAKEGSFRSSSFHSKASNQDDVNVVRVDNFLMVINSRVLNNTGDPLLSCMSPTYLAAVAEDTFVITVVEHQFSRWLSEHQLYYCPRGDCNASGSPYSAQHEPLKGHEPTGLHRASTRKENTFLLQADDNVVALSILQDQYLLAGLSSGDVQVFDLMHYDINGNDSDSADDASTSLVNNNRLIHTFQFHEKPITVIRPLPGLDKAPSSPSSPQMSSRHSGEYTVAVGRSRQNIERSHCFITGAADNILSVFSIDDFTPLKSARIHQAPIADICASNFLANRIIVSCDTTGMTIVSAVNPTDLQAAFVTIWASNIPVARRLHLSYDGSWLCCSPTDGQAGAPQAVPICEWSRLGVGQFHSRRITAIHITTCERYMLTGGADGVIFVWDLASQARHLLSFRKHSLGSSIVSISTSADGSKVASSDSQKFVQLWRRSCGSVIRTVDRGDGESFCRFLPHDYLAVRTRNDLRLYDSTDRLVLRSREFGGGAEGCDEGSIDFYFSNTAESEVCFPSTTTKGNALSDKRRSTMKPEAAGAITDGDDDDDDSLNSANGSASLNLKERIPSQRGIPLDTSLRDSIAEDLRLHCFVAVVGNNNTGNSVNIYRLGQLDAPPIRTLPSGNLDSSMASSFDSSSDEDKMCHEDSVRYFRFLQPKSCLKENQNKRSQYPTLTAGGRIRNSFVDPFSIGSRRDSVETTDFLAETANTAPWGDEDHSNSARTSPLQRSNPTRKESHTEYHRHPQSSPSLFLAATAADDLTVIIWNWFRGMPLAKFTHTSYINSIVFWYPTVPLIVHATGCSSLSKSGPNPQSPDASHDMSSVNEIQQLFTQHDPTFQYNVGFNGLPPPVCLFMTAQDAGGPNDPTLRIFEVRRKGFLGSDTNLGIKEYNNRPLTIRVANTTRRRNDSIAVAAIRPSDGLVCTGSQELVFWRWMSSNPIVSKEMATAFLLPTIDNEECSDSEESNHHPLQRAQHPIRRTSSISRNSDDSFAPPRGISRFGGFRTAQQADEETKLMQYKMRLRPLRRITQRL